MSTLSPLLVLLLTSQAQDLVEKLRSDGVEEREAAARKLRLLGEDAEPLLRAAARGSDPEVAGRARDILGEMEWEASVHPGLLRRYPELDKPFRERDPHWYAFQPPEDGPVRSRREALGEGLEAYYVKLLDHPAASLRTTAVYGLDGSFRVHPPYAVPRRPIPRLVALVVEWDPDACDDAGRSCLVTLGRRIAELGSPYDARSLRDARGRHPDADRVLRMLGVVAGLKEGEPEVLRTLRDGPDALRPLALQVTRRVRLASAKGDVLALLTHERIGWEVVTTLDPLLDASCGEALVRFFRTAAREKLVLLHFQLLMRTGSPECAPLFMDILKSGDAPRRQYAAQALAELGTLEALDLLLDPRVPDDVLGEFLASAAKIARGADIRGLIERLDDPAEKRRVMASSALWSVQNPEARREMARAFEEEKRPDVRKRLLDVLTLHKDDPKALAGLLERVVRNPRDPLAPQAADQLLRLDPKFPVEAVEAILLAQGRPAGQLLHWLSLRPAERMIPHVRPFLEDGGSAQGAVRYLESLGSEAALEELRLASTGSAYVWARDLAASALGRLRRGEREEDLARKAIEEAYAYMRQRPIDELAVGPVPERIQRLKKALAGWDGDLPKRVGEEGIMRCGTGAMWDRDVHGSELIRALAETEDRSLTPLFIDRAFDADEYVREEAIRVLARWKVAEAAPLLKRMVRSAAARERALAIEALTELRPPGLVAFLRSVLRDNPHAAPPALVRLGATECREEFVALLDDPGVPAGLCAALDFLANPELYRDIDRRFDLPNGVDFLELPSVLEKALGVPCRITDGAREELKKRNMPHLAGSSVRELSMAMVRGETWTEGRLIHLFREGTLELCSSEEARAYWKTAR
jgi:HEAT repeat protein